MQERFPVPDRSAAQTMMGASTAALPHGQKPWRARNDRHRPRRRGQLMASRPRRPAQPSNLVLYGTVLLPFAAGYYLSWVYYTINALIADRLGKDLELSPSELGFLTAIYLLGMAVAQIPLGSLSDRRSPRWVQSVCWLIAAAGAIVFATAYSLPILLVGRFLLGIGAATAFTAGANAITLWFPAGRAAFATGLFVTLGSLGAVTATVPAQSLVDLFGWRLVFVLLAVLSVLCAVLTYVVVPDPKTNLTVDPSTEGIGPGNVFADRRFRKLAPVSAAAIGTAWSLQSLWAAPWLGTVEGFDPVAVVTVLFAMAMALSAASLAFGAIAGRWQRHGIPLEKLFGLILLLFLAAQLAIVLRLPIPVVGPWIVIAATGSATVVSYAILATYVPEHRLGRANAALNLLHLLVAFAVQGLIGAIVDLLASAGGAHKPAAYQTAIAIILAIEFAAFAWFVAPVEWKLKDWSWSRRTWPKVLAAHPSRLEGAPYLAARHDWYRRLHDAHEQVRAWRTAALASMTVLLVLATLVLPLEGVQSLLTGPQLAPATLFASSVQ